MFNFSATVLEDDRSTTPMYRFKGFVNSVCMEEIPDDNSVMSWEIPSRCTLYNAYYILG